MPIRPILRYPHPGLKTVCEPVTDFDASLAALADDLLATMRAAPGVGITAAHVGVFHPCDSAGARPGRQCAPLRQSADYLEVAGDDEPCRG